MEIFHRISFNGASKGPETQALDQLLIPYETVLLGDAHGITSFEVSESSESWPRLSKLIQDWKCVDLSRTEFTTAELERASYLVMQPQWITGYPMPDNDGGYVAKTYGQSGCPACGAGRIQQAEFCFSSKPKWGSRNILQLNWIPNEIFVTPIVFDQIHRGLGVESRTVTDSNEKVIDSVLQLVIRCVAPCSLKMVASATRCGDCGVLRYPTHSMGLFPALSTLERLPNIFRTRETFGEGGVSWNEIIVSQEGFQLLKKFKVKPLRFVPLADV